ncbi:Transcriptional adapter ada2, partial [Blyttiomyces sp. JEL0837]
MTPGESQFQELQQQQQQQQQQEQPMDVVPAPPIEGDPMQLFSEPDIPAAPQEVQVVPSFSTRLEDDFTTKYHCDACEKDITYIIHITCAACAEEGLDYAIFDPEWTAQEELVLVDGLKMYGIGNWEQIADAIGTKTKYEVDRHYMEYYVNSETWPLPNMNAQYDKASTRRVIVKDPNPAVRKPERSCTSGPANHEIQGFMPARDEFETEFDNDAEGMVKDMVFEDSDTQEEILLKTSILNVYNTALDRRMERKKFLRDRSITWDFRKITAIEKKRSKEEKDLLNRTRVFAKLQTADDFDTFMDGLLREQKLRQRISELQEYRRMGITNLKDAAEYEKDKIQR